MVSAPPKTAPPKVVTKPLPPEPVSPHTPNVRGPAALDATHVAEHISTQLNAFSEAELASLLSGMNASDRALALQTLHRMTQFGKMKSLNGLADELMVLQGRGYALIEDGVNGSLSSVLKYLRSKGSFTSLYFEDLNTCLTQGKKVAILLDDMMLGKLKSDPAFLQHLRNHSSQVKFAVPEGWQSGINPFNQGSLNGVNGRMTTLMTRAKAIQSTRGGTMEAALSEALTEPVLTQLDALSPGLSKQVIRVQHPEMRAGSIANPELSH
ncbi:MAG: hypothetical protein K2X66_14775, partial [Cyanobacteria bacterium]|nr:hypothetical protein [Cyanobacteriota bacterium]